MSFLDFFKRLLHKKSNDMPKLPVPKVNDIFVLYNLGESYYYIAQIANDTPYYNCNAHEVYHCRLYKITILDKANKRWPICSYVSPELHEFTPSLPGLFMEKHIMLDRYDMVYYYGNHDRIDFFNTVVKGTYQKYFAYEDKK